MLDQDTRNPGINPLADLTLPGDKWLIAFNSDADTRLGR
jgi:hypothetical protein